MDAGGGWTGGCDITACRLIMACLLSCATLSIPIVDVGIGNANLAIGRYLR